MSDDNYQDRLARFREGFPLEYMMLWKIAAKFNEIYNDVYSISDFKGYGIREIKFNVEQRQPGSHTINLSEEGMFFLGAVSHTIIESITSLLASNEYEQRLLNKSKDGAKEYVKQVNPYLLQNYKKCPKCRLDNEYKNKFCYECGEKLPG